MSWSRLTVLFCLGFAVPALAAGQNTATIHNAALSVRVRPNDGAYEISSQALRRVILVSRLGVEANHHWLLSTDYPRHQVTGSSFTGQLGAGHVLTVTYAGLEGRPDLVCRLRLYDNHPYGDVAVQVHNTTGDSVTVNAIRVVDAWGQPRLDLGASEQHDRVLAESFSEDPTIHIGGLDQAPHGDYFGVNNVLIYNLKSHQGLLLAALTSDRFLTVSHLKVKHDSSQSTGIDSLTVDSTGTTEGVLQRDQIPSSQQIQLSLPVAPGGTLSSERVMFASGPDDLNELEAYGQAVRLLHHARIAETAPMGWWSWTAFYGGITAGDVLTNADWLAQHLKRLGYDFFQIDEGYEYARGEYISANATQFPEGMWGLSRKIAGHGLVFGLWTAPFEVSERAWVYQHHKDWLVHDAQGKPIQVGYVQGTSDRLCVLDTTNPGAQDYLRQTYHLLAREWGARYFKLDFMDSSAVEGFYYLPNTTALQAQRIGLKIIREAVGNDVLLDKDGSPMLNPVGLVDDGRISVDTGHDFDASKDAAPNIAARFYMNRNFYISDPDAFSVSRQVEPQQNWHESRKGLTLSEAQVQIVLADVAGGMYEIGDDLPTLGAESQRLALVENQELNNMNRLGQAALPVDLMTFRPQDEQPSVFFLKEDSHQSMLAVFNWTNHVNSHDFDIKSLPLAAGHSFQAYDVLNGDAPLSLTGDALRLENIPMHSVRLIKFIDTSVPAAAPSVVAHVSTTVRAGESTNFSADARGSKVPALAYHWVFGDGTEADGGEVQQTYTMAGTFHVQLSVSGIDGIPAHEDFTVKVTGFPKTAFDLEHNRRYSKPNQKDPPK
ncbi:MAG TPA: PKD domain-containing protein [Terriglobia bacterium]|nr:PKD domain-containing protein [Terriglobia bacterium]